MPLKGVEEPAAKLLKQWLIDTGRQAEWEQVVPDPPDLAFEVKGLGRWAVEVTELQEYYSELVGNNFEPRERTTVQHALWEMVDRIKNQFANEQLQRRYWLNIEGPIVSPSIGKVERRAVDYIRCDRTEEEVLDRDGRIRISVFPCSSPGKIVASIGLDTSMLGGDGKSSVADIRASHEISLKRILEQKLPKLAALTGYQRRVLLIWNSYFFGDPAMVQEIFVGTTLPPHELDIVFFVCDDQVHLVADPGNALIG